MIGIDASGVDWNLNKKKKRSQRNLTSEPKSKLEPKYHTEPEAQNLKGPLK
jgi:hypothetical protein